jgi:hypothetical protein
MLSYRPVIIYEVSVKHQIQALITAKKSDFSSLALESANE